MKPKIKNLFVNFKDRLIKVLKAGSKINGAHFRYEKSKLERRRKGRWR